MRIFAADRLLPLRVVNDVHVLRPLVRSRLRQFQAVDLMRFVFFGILEVASFKQLSY